MYIRAKNHNLSGGDWVRVSDACRRQILSLNRLLDVEECHKFDNFSIFYIRLIEILCLMCKTYLLNIYFYFDFLPFLIQWRSWMLVHVPTKVCHTLSEGLCKVKRVFGKFFEIWPFLFYFQPFHSFSYCFSLFKTRATMINFFLKRSSQQ